MGAFLNTWALAIVPGAVLAVFTLWLNQRKAWFGAPKTRRLNTEEHNANHELLVEAIKWSKDASEGVAKVDGRLTTYIEEHRRVHDLL